ncbi:hypothetical protein EYF80_058880 [Liparis tanakae]|uniref:Uncharacterized protein n=1 Tax=Liparis tanakae TaxID=230148 RepID=A0A4Z2EQ61_9TELE|nr:hypothetical protein EYF80_058880 [Liparis tanakae]
MSHWRLSGHYTTITIEAHRIAAERNKPNPKTLLSSSVHKQLLPKHLAFLADVAPRMSPEVRWPVTACPGCGFREKVLSCNVCI